MQVGLGTTVSTVDTLFTQGTIEMTDKTRYFSIARTVDGMHAGYHEPPTQYAIGLGCELSQASSLVAWNSSQPNSDLASWLLRSMK